MQITTDSTQIDLDTIRNLIESDIRHFLDFYGFVNGVRFDLDVISCVDDTGNWRVFGIDIPILREASHDQKEEILRTYFLQATSQPECAIVMADFREAMRNPPNTGFHCYRAIEAMMQAMKNKEDENDSGAWELLRNNLKITAACLKAVKVHADAPRHGKLYVMTDAQRAYVFGKTRSIILRFLEYLKRGRVSLPESEFPYLRE